MQPQIFVIKIISQDAWETALETPEMIDSSELENAMRDLHKGLGCVEESKKSYLRWKTLLLEAFKTVPVAGKQGETLNTKEIRRHKTILEVRIFRIFEEIERYGKGVADALRVVVIAEDADDIEDSIDELKWEMMQAKRIAEPLDKAKEGYRNLISEITEKEGVNVSLYRRMISDETVKKIISSLEDVSKHLNKVNSNMQCLTGRNLSPEQLDLLLTLQGQIEEITTSQDISLKRRRMK